MYLDPRRLKEKTVLSMTMPNAFTCVSLTAGCLSHFVWHHASLKLIQCLRVCFAVPGRQALHRAYHAYKSGDNSSVGSHVLTEERVNQLLDLGYEFKPGANSKKGIRDVPDKPFETRLEQANKFQDQCGHLKVDHRYSHWDNFGGWCAQISKRHKDWQGGQIPNDNPVTPLEEYQFQQLADLGFGFDVVENFRERRSWDDNFQAFLQFEQYHGHSNVPTMYGADVRLGVWAQCVRRDFKPYIEGTKTDLSEEMQEKYEKLAKAGFPWEFAPMGKRRRFKIVPDGQRG